MAGDHFYTLDPAGELAPQSGYEREGIAGFVFSSAQPNTTPLFRWYHPASGDLAYYRAKQLAGTGPLNSTETEALLGAYRRPIWHGVDTNPNNGASAIVGGNSLWINFINLFPQGDDEIAQSLIHEMMHCAGYTHPDRQASDMPGDGGAYYNSPPLRAELCIAGRQSDSLTHHVQTNGAVMSCTVNHRVAMSS